jgi:exopolysaccharide production protein ExoZ
MERLQLIGMYRLWLILGDASYAIYLVHNPLISMGVRIVKGFHLWPVTFAFCIAIGIVGGVVYHFFVEKPAIAHVRFNFPFRPVALLFGSLRKGGR